MKSLRTKLIKKRENELLLENSPFESCNNSGGVSQETTSKPVNNLKEYKLNISGNFSQQEMG